MKRNSLWDEQKVENYLQQLPTVKDRQSKEELFLVIQDKMEKGRLIDFKQEPVVKKKKNLWSYPAMAAVAAALLLLLIVPSLIKDLSNSAGDMGLSYESTDAGIAPDDNGQGSDEAGIMETDPTEIPEMAEEEGTQEEIVNNTIMVPTPHVVDVKMADESVSFHTFMIREAIEVTEETGESLEEILQYVLTSRDYEVASIFQGLQSIELDEEESIVTMDFAEGHGLQSLATAEVNVATSTIIELFSSYGFGEVKFTLNGALGIQYGDTGYVEGFDLLPENRGYYLYEGEEGVTYFVRAASLEEPMRNQPDTLFTFEETLEKMKMVQSGAWYRSAIPESIDFSMVTMLAGVQAEVIFSEESTVSDAVEFQFLLEALQLAASDFDIETLTLTGALIKEYFGTDSIQLPMW